MFACSNVVACGTHPYLLRAPLWLARHYYEGCVEGCVIYEESHQTEHKQRERGYVYSPRAATPFWILGGTSPRNTSTPWRLGSSWPCRCRRNPSRTPCRGTPRRPPRARPRCPASRAAAAGVTARTVRVSYNASSAARIWRGSPSTVSCMQLLLCMCTWMDSLPEAWRRPAH